MERERPSLINRAVQRNNTAIAMLKKPLVRKVLETLYRPYRLATIDAACIITTKPIKYMLRFSLSSCLRPLPIIVKPDSRPAIDNNVINHLSGLDAWRIRLSEQASRKRINIRYHTNIQYFVIKFLTIIVKDKVEMNHNRALKIKGGSRKMNWRMLKTITTADKKGYFNTNCPCAF